MLYDLKIYLIVFILFFSLINFAKPLAHVEQQLSLQDKQYNRLNKQQKSLEQSINSLLNDITNTEKKSSQTPNDSDKVLLLESSVLSQREQLFNLENQLIPPFTLSRTACLQLKNSQKIQMLDKIKKTKDQLLNLQQQINKAPKCDKITGLQKDTEKQLTLLQSLQKIILTQCNSKSILTPTIYQTNVYADGWILGDQNIDDLIQEYYQRNIRYHNITNCPLEKPFFNDFQCIICQYPDSVFNILTKQCTRCPEDQEPDSNIRQCAWKPHYTNFSLVDNWVQDGASMPFPSKELLPCPPEKPYYNGKMCEICQMPKYWSIKKNQCVECPLGQLFDVSERRCQTSQSNYLTLLQGTRWVTNDCNLTRIISERIQILNLNKTKNSYKLCSPEKPFYDGIACVNCPNEFNIDSRKCVSSTNKAKVYNQNMRCYKEQQNMVQTDPLASNYTTEIPLKDSPTPNCKKAAPYFDGISCIDCLEPFQIFDQDTNKCTACDSMQIYNDNQHKCLPRQKIYISTNEKNLLTTEKTSLDDYHAQINQKIKNNPEAVIMLCKQTEYSNYNNCVSCSQNQYFNIESKTCQICDGSYNEVAKICNFKGYFYTNLNENSVKRIVLVQTTVESQNATINSNLKLHNNSKLCPIDTPYFDGKSCTNCTGQLFNFTANSCVSMQCDIAHPFYNNKTDQCQQCPKDQRFSNKSNMCQPIAYVTNTNAIFFYIEEGNYTKDNLDDQIFALDANNVVITCDPSHPYWNGTNCIDCSITKFAEDSDQHKPFFNLRTLKCQACSDWDNVTKKCKSNVPACLEPKPYFDPSTNSCIACPNNTTFNPSTKNCQTCLEPKPYFDPSTNSCIACPNNTTFNPSTKNCQTCLEGQIYNNETSKCQTWVTNTNAMINNYIEEENNTKANLKSQIEQINKTQQTSTCPQTTPFFSKTQGKCIKCSNPNPYWRISVSACAKCDYYDSATQTCNYQPPKIDVNLDDYYGSIFGG